MDLYPDEPIRMRQVADPAAIELQKRIDENAKCTPSAPGVAIVDPQLLYPLRQIKAHETVLTKERNIAAMIPLEARVKLVHVAYAIYIVRPQVDTMTLLAAHILALTEAFPDTKIRVLFAPKRSLICEHVLRSEFHIPNKVPDFKIDDYDLDLVPVDEDVLSMNMPTAFSDVFMNGDVTVINAVARCIVKLQTARFGPIPNMRAKGTVANDVLRIVQRLQDNEIGKPFLGEEDPDIEQLLIVDRGVDLITPMMSQLTYEGLLSEVYGINDGVIDVPRDADAGSTGFSMRLDMNDRMFAEIRDVNFTRVGATLREKSMYIKEQYDKKNDKSIAIGDLQDFIQNLPALQELHRCLTLHTTVATMLGTHTSSPDFRKQIRIEQAILEQRDEKEVWDYIEDLVNKSAPMPRVLKLLCLLSAVNGGLKQRNFDAIKENLMTTYGVPEVLCLWDNLERSGLIVKNDSSFGNQAKANFTKLKETCRLQDGNLDEKNPADISYTYSGYAPLLVRVLEGMGMCGGYWQGEVMEAIGGPNGELHADYEVPGTTKVTLIFVVGGITPSEISAIRFLAKRIQQAGGNRRFVVATTNITTGSGMMDSLSLYPAPPANSRPDV